MLATYISALSKADASRHPRPTERTQLRTIREENREGDTSYQANIPAIQAWLEILENGEARHFAPLVLSVVHQASIMIDADPVVRPSARSVYKAFDYEGCGSCDVGPEALEAAYSMEEA